VTGSLVVGADTGGTKVKFVLMAAGGERLAQGDVATDRDDPARTLVRLAAAVRDAVPAGAVLSGVGLACAGIVSPGTGRLGRSPNLPGWEGIDLAGSLRSAFDGLPVAIANDVNAALYGEWRLGAGRGCRDLVMIALGTGVGGGVLVGGSLVTGARDGAGEIGHMVLDLAGPVCSCGNRGCLEAFAGEVGLVRRARELAGRDDAGAAYRALAGGPDSALDAGRLHDLAVRGDRTAALLFREAGERLGQAVASLVNVLDPDRVIIGGGVARAGDLILEPCRAVARRLVMAEESRRVPVVPAELGVHAAALGAAAMAREGVSG
jgi:glucokinase